MQGVVGKISSKDWEGKILSSFALAGQDGWYSLGTKTPTFKEGDSIKFDTKQSGKYINALNIVPWKEEGVKETTQVTSNLTKPAFGGWKGQPSKGGFQGIKSQEEKDYWKKKDASNADVQRRIEIQAARNAALVAAHFLIEKEIVKIPTKVAEKYDAYLALVNQVADEFLKNNESRITGTDSIGTPSDGESGADSKDVPKDDTSDEGEWT